MKRQLPLIFTLFVWSLILGSCSQENRQNELDINQTVFYEIFPALLDSMYRDPRIIPPRPPTIQHLIKKGYLIINEPDSLMNALERWKKSDEYKKLMNTWEVKKNSIDRDTNSIYITVYDSVVYVQKNDSIELINHFDHDIVITDTPDFSYGFRIDISKLLPNRKNVKFLYQSQIRKNRELWRTKHGFHRMAHMVFNRILFDQSNTYGVFNAGYVIGPLNGYGVRVFIRKSPKSKWIIDEVIMTWVS